MGMNDDQLSAAEHDAMRSRLMAGTKQIKPAGAHRRAIITSTVAVVLVAGLAGTAIGASSFLRMGEATEPIATPTPTFSPSASPSAVPIETATPSPTEPVTTTPRVAFDGDCNRALSDSDVAALLDTSAVELAESGLRDVEPSLRESAAVLGGLSCYWSSSDGWGWALLDAYPLSVVPESVDLATRSFDCSNTSTCGRAEILGDVWVYAAVGRLQSAEQPMGDDERAVLDERLTRLLDGARSAGPVAVAGVLSPDAWQVPPCVDLGEAVTAAAGFPGAPMGFPGDSLASGPSWEVLVANRVVDWCSWYDEASGVFVELVIQPGLGVPSEAELSAAGAQEVSGLPGQGFLLTNPRNMTPSRLLAMSGPNRLTVSTQADVSPERRGLIASAVISELNAR
ncbi:hypothetical protein DEU34_2356 [Microbacterium sp. AG1240]|nr:hypothetical protein DEU34_2356 [Microbacterium sp. AG1240]